DAKSPENAVHDNLLQCGRNHPSGGYIRATLPDPPTCAAALPMRNRYATLVVMADSPVAELFRYHGRRMRSFLRWRLGTREDAEDASQEVFLRLLRRERASALRTDARAYLTTATYNVAIDVGRRRASHRQHERENL